MPDPSPLPSSVSVALKLRIFGEPVEINAEVASGQIRADEVLPLLRQIDDAAIDRAAGRSEAEGKPISCCRGCSACCRAQPVPITPAEAYALTLLVENLPQPRQSEVRARFADRVRRLFDEGLAQVYLDRDPNLTRDQARDVARRYFAMGLICPFLEDDACGIYHERPFVCRQYLVTSPAALCVNQNVTTQLLGRKQFTIPLTLALEYVARHREELERTFEARDLAKRCIEALVETESA
jgi:Fe-S-cluster containining protein